MSFPLVFAFHCNEIAVRETPQRLGGLPRPDVDPERATLACDLSGWMSGVPDVAPRSFRLETGLSDKRPTIIVIAPVGTFRVRGNYRLTIEEVAQPVQGGVEGPV